MINLQELRTSHLDDDAFEELVNALRITKDVSDAEIDLWFMLLNRSQLEKMAAHFPARSAVFLQRLATIEAAIKNLCNPDSLKSIEVMAMISLASLQEEDLNTEKFSFPSVKANERAITKTFTVLDETSRIDSAHATLEDYNFLVTRLVSLAILKKRTIYGGVTGKNHGDKPFAFTPSKLLQDIQKHVGPILSYSTKSGITFLFHPNRLTACALNTEDNLVEQIQRESESLKTRLAQAPGRLFKGNLFYNKKDEDHVKDTQTPVVTIPTIITLSGHKHPVTVLTTLPEAPAMQSTSSTLHQTTATNAGCAAVPRVVTTIDIANAGAHETVPGSAPVSEVAVSLTSEITAPPAAPVASPITVVVVASMAEQPTTDPSRVTQTTTTTVAITTVTNIAENQPVVSDVAPAVAPTLAEDKNDDEASEEFFDADDDEAAFYAKVK